MAKKGYKQTEEHKRKRGVAISIAKMGKKLSEEHKKNIGIGCKGKIAWNKGLKHTEESRKKMSLSRMGNKNRFGKKANEEMKKRISVATTGINNPNYQNGKKISGSKNPNWKGGIAINPYPQIWKKPLKMAIKERDKYTCQLCAVISDLVVHHIDYNKNNCNDNNLITLCRSCNVKVNFNREKWVKCFQILFC